MVIVATPASAASHISNNYSGQTIAVTQGKTITLITRLLFNEVSPGYYGVTLVWEDNGHAYDNFTIAGARAWIDNDNDNVYDGTDIMLENSTNLASGAGTDGTRWTFTVSNTSGINDEGYICVEIVVRTASRGIIHRATSQLINKAGWGGSIDFAEDTVGSVTPSATTVQVNAWTSGVLVQSGPNAFDNTMPANPPKYVSYPSGPIPLAAAQRIGSGAVFAAGLTSTLDNGRWNAATNPYDNTLDELLDSVIQWGLPGADNVLWFRGHGVFQQGARVSQIRTALAAKGYVVVEDNLDNNITQAKLTPYDVLVIPGMQMGARWSGGNPALLGDLEVEAIDNWVRAGGVLLIFNNTDFSGYNYYRLQNKILAKLGFGWRFQCDSVYDFVDNWGAAAYYLKAQVTQDCPGCGYKQSTGFDNIGVYSPTSLVTPPTFSVDVSLAPASQSGIPPVVLTYTVTVNNTGTGWDNYDLSIADTQGWTPTLSATKLYVAGGASNSTVTASVTIPALTPYCTNDTITVTVTGTENTGGVQAIDSANANAHATAAFAVEIDDIVPETQSGAIGATVTATVVVWNNGGATDNLNLSHSDTLGWGLSLDDYSFLDVPAGESRTTTLNVTIPIVVAGTTDEITVTVTSGNLPSESDDNKCWVTATTVSGRGVAVQIEDQDGPPAHQEAILIIDKEWCGKRYDPLSFKVLVANIGEWNDKYELSAEVFASDPSATLPTLEIMPPELYIQGGKMDFAELSVTVPENAIGCTTYTIIVTAQGTMADSPPWDNENKSDDDMATVHVAIARCVKVDILTQDQTATPGSMLKWWIRIKNLGNVDETQVLTIDQNVWDVNRTYPDWVYVIEPPVQVIPACSIGQAWMEFLVPMDLKTSVRNDITVTATCLEDPLNCNDTDSVSAHVLVPGARIPEAWMKVTVDAEVKAIQLWPTAWDIGVLDETQDATSGIYTVRNTGNVPLVVTISGDDAKSAPGEPTAKWTLGPAIGVDTYDMEYFGELAVWLDVPKGPASGLLMDLVPTEEDTFQLWLQAPGVITVPARMWTIVTLRAI